MKKIAIIGANSYIARNLLFILKKTPHKFDVALYDSQGEHIDGIDNYHSVNILLEESIREINLDVDIIFMFVGKTGSAKGFKEYNTFININEIALLNILNEYKRQNSKAKIIFPSTRLVYRGIEGLCKEDGKKEFKTIYSINKYACEQYLAMFERVYHIRYCIFRICIPYGSLIPGASSYGTAEFMLSKAVKGDNITLYGDGSVRRTLTYIGDLCNMLIQGALSDKCLNDVYNIGGEDYSLLEMAKLIASNYQVEIEFVPWPEIECKIESGSTVFDSSKLDKILQYKREVRYKEWICD